MSALATARRAVLFATVAVVAGAQTFDVRPSEIPGLAIIAPDSPEFEAVLAAQLPDSQDHARLKTMLPFTVAVVNRGPKEVKGIVVRYVLGHGDQPATSHTTGGNSPQLWMQPGSVKLFTPSGPTSAVRRPGGEIDYEKILGKQSSLYTASQVTVSIDSVLFADGEFAGPDQSKSLEFQQRSADDYARFLVEASSKMSSEAELTAWLEDVIREKPQWIGLRLTQTRQILAMMLHSTLKTRGMQEAVTVHERLTNTPELLALRPWRLAPLN